MKPPFDDGEVNAFFRNCYVAELRSHPANRNGNAAIEAQVDAAGHVTSARAVEARGLSPEMTACMVDIVSHMESPPTRRSSTSMKVFLRRPPRPGLRVSEGGAATEEARAQIKALEADFRGCYDDARTTNPALQGSLVLGLTTGPDGSVVDAVAADVEGLGPDVIECITTRARTGRFIPGSMVRMPLKYNP